MIKTGNYIGVMSGTSLDGVDVVVAEISDDYINQRVSYRHPMPETLKKSILSVCQGQCVTLAQLGELDLKLGGLFADAVEAMINNHQLRPKDILAIGCHGQTVWHQPMGEYPFTMQIGDNNQIVARTNIATIGDFRRRDMAYGGQGAPLVPLFHQAFLSAKNERRIVLNVGGMANVSFLFPGCPVQGFDTGPGNMLLDAWIYKNRNLPYDENGLWAKQGRVNYALLELMLSDGYFAELPPKSSGRERFNLQWLENILLKCTEKKVEDIQATLVELTAVTISDQIRLSGGCHRLLVCGGGAHNRLLMDRLKQLLPETKVSPTDDFGIGCDDMEALAFAWLAARTLSGLSGNLPSVTGASQDSVLGAIFPINLQ